MINEYRENEQLEGLWNDLKVYLLTYVNQDRDDPFTEEELYLGLLLVTKHILDAADKSLWMLACNVDSLNRFTKQFLLHSSSIDSEKIGMPNLPKALEHVRSNGYGVVTEAVSAIIENKADPEDFEEVLYGLLISYKNQFAMVYQVLQSVPGMFRNHDA